MATDAQDDKERAPAPELEGGVDWLNTGGPIRLKDLRGKIVLLDFWTYCCINCIHVMPDLEKLEKKYANQIVVIGVHSAKFEGEKDSKNIRDAILRYQIEHPVINDANHRVWNAYGVRSWPTLVLIDPEGNYYGQGSGEGLHDALDKHISKLVETHRQKKTLNERPVRFDLAKFKERKTTPLFFPGKILADGAGKRLFIADSSHHRLVITDWDGKKIDIVGTGQSGKTDGPFDKAEFNDPQGMALKGDTLFVADRKNHLLRAVDLKNKTVKTIAGTGAQGRDRRYNGNPLKVGLNSPWDLWLDGDMMYIAMAGHHQIWRMDLGRNEISDFAGSGLEDIVDDSLTQSAFAQPSGLTSDGRWLYIADSEVSAVRAVSLKADGTVKTIIGDGLFHFGDVDGDAKKARLQHCLGVAFYQGMVYVADTYNNKIKALDPEKQTSTTFLGDGKPGKDNDPPRFDEPAGLNVSGGHLYVADTNNHLIRRIDLKTKKCETITLQGVEPPKIEASNRPAFPNAVTEKLAEKTIPADGDITLEIKLELPDGFKLNDQAPIEYVIETPGGYEHISKLDKPSPTFLIKVPADKIAAGKNLKVSVVYYYCKDGGEGICQVKSQIWEMPIKGDAGAKERTIQLTARGL